MFAISLRDGDLGRRRPAEAVTWFRRAIRHGDRAGWASLAMTIRDGGPGLPPRPRNALRIAQRGWRVARDADAAAVAAETWDQLGDERSGARWWRIAAEAGDAGAMLTFGVCLRYGRGVRRDPAAATRWYRRVVSRTRPLDRDARGRAAWNLSLCHRNGEGVRKDAQKEHAALRLAAAAGHARARRVLATSILDGRFGPDDSAPGGGPVRPRRQRTEGERRLRELAATDSDAAIELGTRLVTGKGLRRRVREGLAILRRFARRRHCDAIAALGALHLRGEHVRRDPREAVRLFRSCTRHGSACAWRSLGLCYAEGAGVRQDARRARRCFVNAARGGDDDAACRLHDGVVARDPLRAAEFLRSAAADEGPGALVRMARLLRDGAILPGGTARRAGRRAEIRPGPGRPTRQALAHARDLLRLAEFHGADVRPELCALRAAAGASGPGRSGGRNAGSARSSKPTPSRRGAATASAAAGHPSRSFRPPPGAV